MARGQTGFVEGKISRCCCRPTFWYLCPIFRKRLYGVCARGGFTKGLLTETFLEDMEPIFLFLNFDMR